MMTRVFIPAFAGNAFPLAFARLVLAARIMPVIAMVVPIIAIMLC